MRPTRVSVVETESDWRIQVDGDPVGRFARQIDAVNCAADLVAEIQRDGGYIELLVQDLAGDITVLDGEATAPSRSTAV